MHLRPVMFARPEAKPLIRGPRVRSMRQGKLVAGTPAEFRRYVQYCPLIRQFTGGEKVPVSTPRKPPLAEAPGARVRFQFAGVTT